ncbi:regulatory protein, FmdB family [Spirochaeta thermophila DSM 6578]|uniref:Regulatory protein, FmdB family n=1 Tax=Winmispira thermophila (strain ATCC 700085 / DSM 6578 / Z-1203) TaxID=869211 RepID=G0GB92_WINT7|nr:FmdB family zinc ribbon protein [Spirochaeta thermophila]AEJ61901.1 regulatory protein, FmdB family [Spirochaeta thermophila DSM 6578]
MPTYEYECTSCGHVFEAFQSISEEPIRECPECGNTVRRLISGGTGIIFKGSGFYVTDSKKSSSSKPEKKEEKKAKDSAA